jgi:hypothetical protein
MFDKKRRDVDIRRKLKRMHKKRMHKKRRHALHPPERTHSYHERT